MILIIVSEALPCFDLGVTWERKVTSPQSKIKHSCNLKFLKNLVQNLRRSGLDVQYLSEILNSCILSVSFKPPAVNGIYIKVKIYSFIQTTRYFILTIEAVRSEERVFETESTIFLLKFLPISCFFFFFHELSLVLTGSIYRLTICLFSNVVKTTISQAKRGCAPLRAVVTFILY